MSKLGILVGEEKWTFFNDIFEDLNEHYQIDVFKDKKYNLPLLYGRFNRWDRRRRIRLMLQRNDICFFEWASELLVQASYMPKHCGIVTRLHSFELYEWAPKVNWDHIDKVILLSKTMQHLFNKLYPAQKDKTEVIYNGVSLTKFKPLPDRRFGLKIGMLGHIIPIKRVYEVIITVFNLRSQGYEITLHIGGAPEGDLRYFAAIKRLIIKLELENNVVFDGFVEDSPAWLSQIDIFISNSFWEGQQVALLEAMAAGCYCLSHNWPGSEEVLPEEFLYITEANLQNKIILYAHKSYDEKRKCHELFRTFACEKFDIEQTKARIRQTLSGLH